MELALNQPTNASQYYTYRDRLQKKWVKLSIGAADMIIKQQIICKIKVRRAPTTRHDDDNVDFKPIVTTKSAAEIKPLSIVVVADKGYDSGEENHVLVRDDLKAYSIIPSPRYQQEEVPIWKTYGRYRKQMKHGYLLKTTVQQPA
jgi:hypothetical protein